MSLHPVIMMPYRDANNQEIKYAPLPSLTQQHSNPYDSDAEPLISPSPTELDEDSAMRFTATGRPMPTYKHSNLQSLGTDMYSLPQLLPKPYTDDSIIPAIIVGVIPSDTSTLAKAGRRNSFISRLKGEGKMVKHGKLTKVVYMPRRDYLKHFARGFKGEYIGTEPYRQWTEGELQEDFGKYTPVLAKRKGFTVSC